MIPSKWVIVWLLFGVYFVIAAIGGSAIGAIMALVCGFVLGQYYPHKEKAHG